MGCPQQVPVLPRSPRSRGSSEWKRTSSLRTALDLNPVLRTCIDELHTQTMASVLEKPTGTRIYVKPRYYTRAMSQVYERMMTPQHRTQLGLETPDQTGAMGRVETASDLALNYFARIYPRKQFRYYPVRASAHPGDVTTRCSDIVCTTVVSQ